MAHLATQALVNTRFKVLATLGIAWERTVVSKQTLFPVFANDAKAAVVSQVPATSTSNGNESRRAHKGAPPLKAGANSFPKSENHRLSATTSSILGAAALSSSSGGSLTASGGSVSAAASATLRRSSRARSDLDTPASSSSDASSPGTTTSNIPSLNHSPDYLDPFVEHSLRATKGVNMHPFPELKLFNSDGTLYTKAEEVRLSLVEAHTLKDPATNLCPCKGHPVLKESKPSQLVNRDGETYSTVTDGALVFEKLQLKCCTGARGHDSPFRIKAEFVDADSPFAGYVTYSPPIEVGAKGPFAKIFEQNKQRQLLGEAIVELRKCASQGITPSGALENGFLKKSTDPRGVAALTALGGFGVVAVSSATGEDAAPAETNMDTLYAQVAPAMNAVAEAASYEGSDEMIRILGTLGLHKYLFLFLEHEVDPVSLRDMDDKMLVQMGVTKVGPRIKLLNKIRELKEGRGEKRPASSLLLPKQRVPGVSPPSSGELPEPIVSKRRRTGSRSPSPSRSEEPLSVHAYLSHVFPSSSECVTKVILVVKSHLSFEETDSVVQGEIQRKLLKKAQGQMSSSHASNFDITKPAQLLLSMSSSPTVSTSQWFARTSTSDEWECRIGDALKLDNHHDRQVEVVIRSFVITDSSVGVGHFVEDFRSPTVFPRLFPGSSLELDLVNEGGSESHPFAHVADCLTRGSIALAEPVESTLLLSVPRNEENDMPLCSADSGTHPFCITRDGLVLGQASPRQFSISETQDSCVFSFRRAHDRSTPSLASMPRAKAPSRPTYSRMTTLEPLALAALPSASVKVEPSSLATSGFQRFIDSTGDLHSGSSDAVLYSSSHSEGDLEVVDSIPAERARAQQQEYFRSFDFVPIKSESQPKFSLARFDDDVDVLSGSDPSAPLSPSSEYVEECDPGFDVLEYGDLEAFANELPSIFPGF